MERSGCLLEARLLDCLAGRGLHPPAVPPSTPHYLGPFGHKVGRAGAKGQESGRTVEAAAWDPRPSPAASRTLLQTPDCPAQAVTGQGLGGGGCRCLKELLVKLEKTREKKKQGSEYPSVSTAVTCRMEGGGASGSEAPRCGQS